MITIEFLNYLQEKDKMVREFKFFYGITIESNEIQGMVRRLRANWQPEPIEHDTIDAEQELTSMLSNEISRTIDEDIIQRLIDETTENIETTSSYLNYWLNIGGNRA